MTRTEAILSPAEIARLPGRDLSRATCVVFDVLRATSTMLTAVANGARRIYPVSTVAEARESKATRWPDALLGGERGGVRIEGFDLGNSPGEYTPEVVGGRDIISTTTNGTVALRACAGAKEVLAGAWLNLQALAQWLRTREAAVEHLIVICAGTGENFALEDGYAAGGLIARLRADARAPVLDDAALALRALYERHPDAPLDVLHASANGRRLEEIGLGADVALCAAPPVLPWVAVRRGDGLEGEFVASGR